MPFKIDATLIDKFYTKNIKCEDYEIKLKKNRNIDTLVGGCAIGPHKSDYMFCVNDNSITSVFKLKTLRNFDRKTVNILRNKGINLNIH